MQGCSEEKEEMVTGGLCLIKTGRIEYLRKMYRETNINNPLG